jgi:hypothetical protein
MSWILFHKQVEPYHVSLRRTQRHLAEYNRKIHFFDKIVTNLVQINVIRCKSIIVQSAQRMFMSLQCIFIVVY